ncbi:hypothetical protein KIPB_006845 [Kipferlia bialata]|uniref:Alpha-1,3/1,6-mannosyltransferase ALG2 n=1 Tax=Kipferlia bialata TaxID=797122 RepID=A0A9K3D086_9EUKA|nr:hypothetical protein KIPB_006845 [Kipferlia bialata]|eukprot:g6845.t1
MARSVSRPSGARGSGSLRIGFVHPYFVLGGAERLMLDAALAYKRAGHTVDVFTSHLDRQSCFDELRDGTLPVTVVAQWLPRSIYGRVTALLTYLHTILVALYLAFSRFRHYDLVVVDQVSLVVPILKIACPKVIFYCHFPDKLLSSQTQSNYDPLGPSSLSSRLSLRSIYRFPLDIAEERTCAWADAILCNSGYTRSVFRRHFPSLARKPVRVVPPCVRVRDFVHIKHPQGHDAHHHTPIHTPLLEARHPGIRKGKNRFWMVSIARFEPAKNMELAIQALSELQRILRGEGEARTPLYHRAGGPKSGRRPKTIGALLDEAPRPFPHPGLILTGSASGHSADRYIAHLRRLVTELGLEDDVLFVPSFSQAELQEMLSLSKVMLFTPPREHFGITPLEAMAAGVPVIAINQAGPSETVLHDKTGFLVPPVPRAFAAAVCQLMLRPKTWRTHSQAARTHTVQTYGPTAFGSRLLSITDELVQHAKKD